jgi:FKBP-type peptidyl-prolyl cis-trans isomerase FkpA
MQKNSNLHVIVFLLTSVLFTSCFSDDDNQKREEEQQQIEEYVKKNNITPALINAYGLYYIERQTGTGDTLTSNSDFALIKYRGKYLSGKLFDTSDSTEAKTLTTSIPWQAIGGLFKISAKSNFYGLIQGLALMKEGGKSTLIIPSLLSYNDYIPRIYEIDSFKVIHNIVEYETKQFQDTIKALNRDLKDSTKNGSYVFLYQDTTGLNKPVSGDSATVTYTGYIIDGRVFSKTRTLKYRVGTFPVVGFDEAVVQMAKGVKGKVYVPYYGGYGTDAALDSYTGQIIVPAYSGLKYQIELVSFK